MLWLISSDRNVLYLMDCCWPKFVGSRCEGASRDHENFLLTGIATWWYFPSPLSVCFTFVSSECLRISSNRCTRRLRSPPSMLECCCWIDVWFTRHVFGEGSTRGESCCDTCEKNSTRLFVTAFLRRLRLSWQYRTYVYIDNSWTFKDVEACDSSSVANGFLMSKTATATALQRVLFFTKLSRFFRTVHLQCYLTSSSHIHRSLTVEQTQTR